MVEVGLRFKVKIGNLSPSRIVTILEASMAYCGTPSCYVENFSNTVLEETSPWAGRLTIPPLLPVDH